MSSKAKRQRLEMAKQAYGTVMDMGHVLRATRLASGLNVDYIAQCMNTTRKDWMRYEQNLMPIPGHIIIKLMIFGMEFWARNKSCFENATSDTPSRRCDSTAAATPPRTTHAN